MNNSLNDTARFTRIQLDKMGEIFYDTFTVLLGILSIILNVLVLILYYKVENIRDTTVIFLPLFTFNDIFVAFFRLIFYFLLKFINLYEIPAPICVYINVYEIVIYIQSQYYLLFIFIFKYIRIKYPLKYKDYYNFKLCLLIIFLIIICTILLCLFPVYISFFKKSPFSGCNGYFYYKPQYYFIYLLYFIPVIISVVIIHANIMKIAKKHAKNLTNQMKNAQNISYSSKLTLIQLILSIIVWLIFGLSQVSINSRNGNFVYKLLLAFGYLVLTQLLINPIITIIGNSSIKYEFLKVFSRFRNKRQIHPQNLERN